MIECHEDQGRNLDLLGFQCPVRNTVDAPVGVGEISVEQKNRRRLWTTNVV